MKNKLFLCTAVIAACAFSMNVNAQLEVTSAGNVKATKIAAIGTDIDNNIALNVHKTGPNSSTPTYGIKSLVQMPSYTNYTLYGVYGEADARNTTSMQDPHPIVGVYGTAKTNHNLALFTAGVAGLAHWRGGIGVFGGINNTLSTLPIGAKYAGYFCGTTKVDGTLLANMLVLNGDTLNINKSRGIPADAANSLTQLHPISYSFKSDSTLKYDEKLQREMEGTHYGLVAQEVQKVLPELVYEREGKLSINYIEIIPLLIMKVQELSAEVEFLKQEKVEQTYRKAPAANVISEQAVLYQNVPNPFTIDTKIAYQLPESTRNASLYIYNMNGLQVADYPISSFGEGLVIVSAGSLEAGMYLYSLVADGQVVDTKRMILTK